MLIELFKNYLVELFHRTLLSCMVDGVIPCEDQLGNGDEGIALFCEIVENVGQRLGGVKSCVVKEDDRPRLYLARNAPGDLGGGEVLPVETVHIPHKGKSFGAG